MQITWKGGKSLEIKAKDATILTGDDVRVNDIVLPGPGEYEVAGVQVFGIAPEIYFFRIDEIACAYFDGINRSLTDDEVSSLTDASVIFIPVGGKGVLDPKKATEIIKLLEPTVIIPIEADDITDFCKVTGVCAQPVSTYKITKQQLESMEGQTCVVLEKS